MLQFIAANYVELTLAALVFARVVFSLIPSEHPAQSVFATFDRLITTLVGGDRRKAKRDTNQPK